MINRCIFDHGKKSKSFAYILSIKKLLIANKKLKKNVHSNYVQEITRNNLRAQRIKRPQNSWLHWSFLYLVAFKFAIYKDGCLVVGDCWALVWKLMFISLHYYEFH